MEAYMQASVLPMNFKVLDRSQVIHKNTLLEASAGTGKTYSIENIFLRLLVETGPHRKEPLKVNEILAVTFTKAAAADLKARIRHNLEKTLRLNENWPDFLEAIREKGDISFKEALSRIEEAIFNFDQAPIFTIHGFCFKALQEHAFEGGLGMKAFQEKAIVSREEQIVIVRNFMATELKNDFLSPCQLEILINKHGKASKLEASLLDTLGRGIPIRSGRPFKVIFNLFLEAVEDLREEGITPEAVLSTCLSQVAHYKDFCNRSGQLKKSWMEIFTTLASLFDEGPLSEEALDAWIKTQGVFFEAFLPHQLKAKAKPPPFDLFLRLQAKLGSLTQEACTYENLFANLAARAQKQVQRYLDISEKLDYGTLLQKMHEAITQNTLFKENLRTQYAAAIIDEFQDTDPLQWQIFQTLFLHESKGTNHLYLVGDPKQSIYAFRNADVYTYLNAENALGSDCKASLTTNYRAAPNLVNALNSLFSEETAPGWISLPSLKSHLPYTPSQSSERTADFPFKDTLGSLHFCLTSSKSLEVAEETSLFPYFAQEIKRLNTLDHCPYREMAVLVKDRYQAKRLAACFEKEKIPVTLQRSETLENSLGLKSLLELLRAVLRPYQENLLMQALGGKIIALSVAEITSLNENALAEFVEKMHFLKEILNQKGFGLFLEELLDAHFFGQDKSLREKLLSREQGECLYRELCHIAAILLEIEAKEKVGLRNILSFLEELQQNPSSDDEALKIDQDLTREAVKILTIHASKGLEYGVVFVPGLLHRSTLKSGLSLLREGHEQVLAPLSETSSAYALFVEELEAEKMRQLYVGLTRAKYRVYIPVVEGVKLSKKGSASPMELFLAKSHPGICETAKKLEAIVAEAKGLISLLKIESPNTFDVPSQEEKITLIEPVEVFIPGKPLYRYSFTSLSSCTKDEGIESLPLPHDFKIANKTAHTLPAGPLTGLLLHQIFEEIPFQASEEEWAQSINLMTANTPFQEWEKVLEEMVKNALTLPLGDEKIRLRELKSGDFFREKEFLCSSVLMQDIEECNSLHGVFNGFVDLIFTAGGKYYLLDWKSNWLGANSLAYSEEVMEKAMRDQNYFLQAAIYTAAFKKFIELHEERPFEECFGGFFYLFLRGLNPGTSLGVYKVKGLKL